MMLVVNFLIRIIASSRRNDVDAVPAVWQRTVFTEWPVSAEIDCYPYSVSLS